MLLPSTLASLLAASVVVGQHCADLAEQDAPPEIDLIIDSDDDAGETYIRVSVNGVLLYSANNPQTQSAPRIRFHLLDSGPFDDSQSHVWAERVTDAALHAPATVRSYIADRVLAYHQPPAGDCRACPDTEATRKARGFSMSDLNDLDPLQLIQLLHAVQERLHARRLDEAREILCAALADVHVAGAPVDHIAVPTIRPHNAPASAFQFDPGNVRFRCGTADWMSVDLRGNRALVDALSAVRQFADDDPDDPLDELNFQIG
ncbi:hypothetical protein [Kitasatospora sp. NPDC059327]|uniref:hypothetical protein n=1 Tax=Kitasatospora sp. NPDC059327 TaxID=3346803 RepID=UPI0036926024